MPRILSEQEKRAKREAASSARKAQRLAALGASQQQVDVILRGIEAVNAKRAYDRAVRQLRSEALRGALGPASLDLIDKINRLL